MSVGCDNPIPSFAHFVKCCFCNLDELIRHLFVDCENAKFIWRLLQVSFNLPIPLNVEHVFSNWLYGILKKLKHQILVGACVLFWSIWLSHNDKVFF